MIWYGAEAGEIEAFLVLAEELHFGRTAQRLRLSPSRASQLIRLLERRVGGALFERTSRQVRLTPLGAELEAEIRPAHALLERALAAARERARGLSGFLRIGHLPHIDRVAELAALIERFERRHPGCRVARLRFDTSDMFGVLRRGEADVWVSTWPLHSQLQPPSGISAGPVIARRRGALLMSAAHPLASRERLTMDDLADYPPVEPTAGFADTFRGSWVPDATPSGRPIRTVTPPEPVGSLQELLYIVGSSDHLAHLTAGPIARDLVPGLCSIPITDGPEFGFIPFWQTTAETAITRAFAALIGKDGTPPH